MAVQEVIEWYPLPEVVGDELKWQLEFASFGATDSLHSDSSSPSSVSTLRPTISPTATPQRLLATPNDAFSPLVLETASEATSLNNTSITSNSSSTPSQQATVLQQMTSQLTITPRGGSADISQSQQNVSALSSGSATNRSSSVETGGGAKQARFNGPLQREGTGSSSSLTKGEPVGPSPSALPPAHDISITSLLSTASSEPVRALQQRGGGAGRGQRSSREERGQTSSGARRGQSSTRDGSLIEHAPVKSSLKSANGRKSNTLPSRTESIQAGNSGFTGDRPSTRPKMNRVAPTSSQTPHSEAKPGHNSNSSQTRHLQRKPGDTQHTQYKPNQTSTEKSTKHHLPHATHSVPAPHDTSSSTPQLPQSHQLNQLWRKYLSTPLVTSAIGDDGIGSASLCDERVTQQSVTPFGRSRVSFQDERALRSLDNGVSKPGGYKDAIKMDDQASLDASAMDWWIQRRVYLNDRSIQTTPSLENQTPFRHGGRYPDPVCFSVPRPSPAQRRVEIPRPPPQLPPTATPPPPAAGLRELSLQDALSLFHPAFIQHSQARQRSLRQQSLRQHRATTVTTSQDMQHRHKKEDRGGGGGAHPSSSSSSGRRRRCVECGHARLDQGGGRAAGFIHFNGSSARPKQSVKAMYQQSKRHWSQLAEVRERVERESRMAEAATNRLRVKLYQKEVLARMRRKL